MPGASSAWPCGEGLDLAQISAAVGEVILGNSGAGLLKNIGSSGDIRSDLARESQGDHASPRTHAGGSIVEGGHAADQAGRRTWSPGNRHGNTGHWGQDTQGGRGGGSDGWVREGYAHTEGGNIDHWSAVHNGCGRSSGHCLVDGKHG